MYEAEVGAAKSSIFEVYKLYKLYKPCRKPVYSPCEVNHVETSAVCLMFCVLSHRRSDKSRHRIKLQIGPSMRCERKICFLCEANKSFSACRPLPALFPPFPHLCNKRSYWIQVTNQSKTSLKSCASVISTPGRILQYVWKAVLIFI